MEEEDAHFNIRFELIHCDKVCHENHHRFQQSRRPDCE
jgi:hypothetical protein